jgi:hypothetical protein
MANYIPTITIDNVIDALATFITPFVGGAAVIRAQVNRVPMPSSPCVVLTELFEMDLETPTALEHASTDLYSFSSPTRVDIQIDFYGPSAGDQCKAIKQVFRTCYATSQFSDGIKPLYCSQGIQSPLITGEQQWESRWTLTASLQYNPVVDVPQQFADALDVDVQVPVDLTNL